MQFDDNHKVIIETLKRNEAPEVVRWFREEIQRHRACETMAENQKILRPLIHLILESACIRHREDIKAIKERIKRVKERFEL